MVLLKVWSSSTADTPESARYIDGYSPAASTHMHCCRGRTFPGRGGPSIGPLHPDLSRGVFLARTRVQPSPVANMDNGLRHDPKARIREHREATNREKCSDAMPMVQSHLGTRCTNDGSVTWQNLCPTLTATIRTPTVDVMR